MPRKYPQYPYAEPAAVDITDAEIEAQVLDLISQNPQLSMRDGGPLDTLCRALNVDVEYSELPNDVLLDVPLDAKPVIWLGKNGKPRHDRLNTAIALGHWLIHVPLVREDNPGHGVQVLYKPADPRVHEEARRFAFALLMPRTAFESLWYEGRAALTADTLNVPTQAVYDRAKTLMLTGSPAAAE